MFQSKQQNSLSQWLNYYMASGVMESGIQNDGGEACYSEIPKTYQIIVMTSISLVMIYIMKTYKGVLTEGWSEPSPQTIIQQDKKLKNKVIRILEKLTTFISIVTFVVIFILKIQTRKLAFIFNPCHVSLLIAGYLISAPKNKFNKQVHAFWSSWIYGAALALITPHTDGVTRAEIYFFYIQHYLILPIAPIILYQHYGFDFPSLQNHVISFASVVLYQYSVLGPIAILTKVNLNFILCHTPVDLWIDYYGYNYFIAGIFVLGLFSIMTRLVLWIIFWACQKVFKNKDKQKLC